MKMWLYVFTTSENEQRDINTQLNTMLSFCNAGRHEVIGSSFDSATIGTPPETLYKGLEQAKQACLDGMCDVILIAHTNLINRHSFVHTPLARFYWDAKLNKPRIVSTDSVSLYRTIQEESRKRSSEYARELSHKQPEREKWLWNQTMWQKRCHKMW